MVKGKALKEREQRNMKKIQTFLEDTKPNPVLLEYFQSLGGLTEGNSTRLRGGMEKLDNAGAILRSIRRHRKARVVRIAKVSSPI